MIDLIEIFQNQDKLNEHLTYLQKVKSIDPRIKPIKKFIDDASSKLATKKLYLSGRDKKILENLETVFEETKDKISEERYQTFYHEFGHIYTALASGFEFSAIIINDKNKKILHVFYLENELSTKVLYYRYNIKHKSKKISSNGVSIFYYKDYRDDNDIHDKISLTAISGIMVQQDYLNSDSLKISFTNRCSLLRSFGITRIRSIGRIGDANQVLRHTKFLNIKKKRRIALIDDLNDVHETLYNTGTKEEFNKYPIQDISKEIQKTMSRMSK